MEDAEVNNTQLYTCNLWQEKTKSSDWFEAKVEFLNPVIDKKRQIQCANNNHPGSENFYKLRQARNAAKQMVRSCAYDYS